MSAWQGHQEAMIAAALPILPMVAAQLLSRLVDWLKYHRFSNYHAYTAR